MNRLTDGHTQPIVAFRNFANAHKKQIQLYHHKILMSANSINGTKIQYKVNMELININEQSINHTNIY